MRLRLEGAGAPELLALEEGARAGAQDDGSWTAQAVGAPDPLRRVHAGEL